MGEDRLTDEQRRLIAGLSEEDRKIVVEWFDPNRRSSRAYLWWNERLRCVDYTIEGESRCMTTT